MLKVDKTSVLYYDVYPKIVLEGKVSRITINPTYVLPFETGKSYEIRVSGMRDHAQGNYEVKSIDGTISFEHEFKKEQEYSVKITSKEDTMREKNDIVFLYCLKEDLYNLKPCKGDFHFHTQYSDGQQTPAAVCALARQKGIDFMAVTDHRRYNPSLMAIDAYKDADTGMKLFPGEEVHFQGSPHLVAFGGNFGLGEKYSANDYTKSQEYKDELVKFIEEHAEEIEKLPPHLNRESYIKIRHGIETIRSTGALCILAHPYWMHSERYAFNTEMSEYLCENRLFDVYELVNGSINNRFALQINHWNEHREKGNCMPIVSGSDTHNTTEGYHFGTLYTIVFVKNLDMPNIREAVLSRRNVVANTIDSENPYVYGNFRYTMYANYLIRQIFPIHDEICLEDGKLMLRHANGDTEASKYIAVKKKEIEALYEKLWLPTYK